MELRQDRWLSFFNVSLNVADGRGESAALGQRMPCFNRLFSKSMKGKILNFLHEVEKMISVISVQVQLKKKASFSRDKSKIFVQSFSLLKLAKPSFHF